MRRAALAALASGLLACGDPAPSGALHAAPMILDAVPYEAGLSDAGASPADAAPGRRVLFVAPRASATRADGTRDRPFPEAETAFSAARAGDLVVLLPGEHAAWTTSPPPGVEVEGLDRDRVRVSGPMRLAAADARVRNLTVVGGAPGIRATAATVLENVRVVDTQGNGVEVAGGPFSATEVAVENAAGVGLLATVGPVELADIRVLGARGGGIRLTEVTTDAVALSISEVDLDIENVRAHGLEIEGGEATIRGVTIGRVGDRGVRIAQGARATVSDIAVDGPVADGVAVLSGADAILEDVRIAGAGNVGLTINEATGTVRRARVVGGGRAGALFSKGAFTVERMEVADAPDRGVSVLDGEGRLSGLYVHGAANVGLQVTDPRGPVVVVDGIFEDNGVSGVAAFGVPEGRLRLEGVTTRGSRLGPEDLGEGLHVYKSSVTAVDLVSEGNGGGGVLVEQASLTLERSTLRGNGGPGLVAVESEGGIHLDAVHAEANHGAGVLVIGGVLVCRGLVAQGTLAAPDGTADGVELVGAVATMTGDELSGNAGNGLYLFGDAHATATDLNSHDNGGYGQYVACDDSSLVLDGASTSANNGAGERNTCR